MNFSLQKGWTALTIASSKGHDECVKLLLEKCAEVDHKDGVSVVSHSLIDCFPLYKKEIVEAAYSTLVWPTVLLMLL